MEENKLDVRKAFQALASIIGDRYGLDIEVKEIKKKKEAEQSA